MPDPWISVLLPSRHRPESLRESVASLLDLAQEPGRVEVLVAADPDDPATKQAVISVAARCWVAPERFGYHRFHEYINRLADLAQGDWLFLWNDDARMLTEGWDARIREAPAGVLWPRHNDSPFLNVFPVVHRRFVELTGHFSLSNHADSWVQDVAQAAGIHHRIDVEALHDRHDLTGGHDDEVYREAREGYRTSEYHSPVMVALRQKDIDTIKRSWEH